MRPRSIRILLLLAVLLPAAACGGGGGGGGSNPTGGTPGLACDYPLPVLHYCTEIYGPVDPNNNGCVQGGGTILPACSKSGVAGTCRTMVASTTSLTYVYGTAITQQAVASACPNGMYTVGYDGGVSSGGGDGGVRDAAADVRDATSGGDVIVALPEGGVACNNVANTAPPFIRVVTQDPTRVPIATGGTIVGGTYYMVGQTAFMSSGSVVSCAAEVTRSTLRVAVASPTSGAFQFADEAVPGDGNVHVSATNLSYVVTSPTTLDVTVSCSPFGTGTTAAPARYSSEGSNLFLFFGNGTTCVDVEMFTRQ